MLLLESFKRWIGRSLIEYQAEADVDFPQALFDAPFVVVSHDTSADPIFNYGNRTALHLFEMSWADFTKLPSRESAEPINRDERSRLLEAVTRQNFIDDYSGVRISASGQRFWIPRAIVWNLQDDEGVYRGQAATFSEWSLL